MTLAINLKMVAHDTRNHRLNFGARVDGVRASFAITEAALLHLDGVDRPRDTDALIGIVHINAKLISKVATQLWNAGRIEPDGYILLHPADVMTPVQVAA